MACEHVTQITSHVARMLTLTWLGRITHPRRPCEPDDRLGVVKTLAVASVTTITAANIIDVNQILFAIRSKATSVIDVAGGLM